MNRARAARTRKVDPNVPRLRSSRTARPRRLDRHRQQAETPGRASDNRAASSRSVEVRQDEQLPAPDFAADVSIPPVGRRTRVSRCRHPESSSGTGRNSDRATPQRPETPPVHLRGLDQPRLGAVDGVAAPGERAGRRTPTGPTAGRHAPCMPPSVRTGACPESSERCSTAEGESEGDQRADGADAARCGSVRHGNRPGLIRWHGYSGPEVSIQVRRKVPGRTRAPLTSSPSAPAATGARWTWRRRCWRAAPTSSRPVDAQGFIPWVRL